MPEINLDCDVKQGCDFTMPWVTTVTGNAPT
jgi:hypothetical protein